MSDAYLQAHNTAFLEDVEPIARDVETLRTEVRTVADAQGHIETQLTAIQPVLDRLAQLETRLAYHENLLQHLRMKLKDVCQYLRNFDERQHRELMERERQRLAEPSFRYRNPYRLDNDPWK